MTESRNLAKRIDGRLALMFCCWLVASFLAVAAGAMPPEAEAVVDGMIDGKIVEQVDYAFLAVDYDESANILYFAARDGGHFDPAMESIYRVPIAAINVVNVISNTDVTVKDGKQMEIEPADGGTDEADFIRLKRGCTVKLVAKEADFGWVGLAEGQITDGHLTVDYEELDFASTMTVDVGFFVCDHARALQRDFHKLHKEVKAAR